jgi:cytochrome b pre-mRNA-processing protein 3
MRAGGSHATVFDTPSGVDLARASTDCNACRDRRANPRKEPNLFRWTKRSPRADTIRSLYGVIVAQARRPAFYADYGVPDTPAGRFDMILLHLILFVRRLRPESAPIRSLGQGVFDLFCRDMDHSFREMGIGDLSVPKHMRRVAEAFYGRAVAYDEAIAGAGEEQLAAVLARNIFAESTAPSAARRLARYVRGAINDLDRQQAETFVQARLGFPDPDLIAAPACRREEQPDE